MKLEPTELYTKCKTVKEKDYKEVFAYGLAISQWIKTKKAYAVAANQLGSKYRLMVAHRRYKKLGLPTDIFINPEFSIGPEAERIIWGESCLSYPGVQFEILRWSHVELSYYDPREKEDKKYFLEGLPAIIAQHEITHLNGENEEELSFSVEVAALMEKKNIKIEEARQIIIKEEGK